MVGIDAIARHAHLDLLVDMDKAWPRAVRSDNTANGRS
jgi:hypothetical protein